MPAPLVFAVAVGAAIAIPVVSNRLAKRWNDDVGDYLSDQHPLEEGTKPGWPAGGGSGAGVWSA